MIKVFCDACGMQINRPNKVEIPCHLFSMAGMPGYVDSDFNAVSGRVDGLDLCNGCNNIAFGAMVDAIKDIQTDSGSDHYVLQQTKG